MNVHSSSAGGPADPHQGPLKGGLSESQEGRAAERRMADGKIATYAEFWPHYLRAHSDPRTRLVHYAGTAAGLALALAAAARADWRLLVAAPIVGYAAAWFAHFAFEGNRPATFGHPLWSFWS